MEENIRPDGSIEYKIGDSYALGSQDLSFVQNLFGDRSKLNLSPNDERSVATDPSSE